MQKKSNIVNLLHIEVGGLIIDAKNENAVRDIQQRLIKTLEDPEVKVFMPDFEMQIRSLQVDYEKMPKAMQKAAARILTPTVN